MELLPDATFNYENASDGSIQFTGHGLITYTGLEPITSNINATNVTLNYSEAAETIRVSNAGNGRTTVTSTAAETTTFNNPTGTFTINAGNVGANSIGFNSLANNYPANIDINGGDSGDEFRVTTSSINLAADKSLSVDAKTIWTGRLQSYTTTGTGRIDFNASDFIYLPLSTFSTVDGGITMVANPTGTTTGGSNGLKVQSTSIVTSGTGEISLAGQGDSESFGHRSGISFLLDSTISSTSTGNSAGAITLNGEGLGSNSGVTLSSSTKISSATADITIIGQSGNLASSNSGVVLDDAIVELVTGDLEITGLVPGLSQQACY